MGKARWMSVALGLVAASAASVKAEPSPSLDLSRLEVPTDPRGGLLLEPASTPGPGAWNVGTRFAYSYRSITLRDAGDRVFSVPLAHQLAAHYFAALGLGQRFAVGLVLPTVLYQSGDNLQALGDPASLVHTAFGDLGLTAKATLPSPGEGIGLGILGRLTLPTGNRSSYLGEGALTGELRLLGELDLQVLVLRATAGATLRAEERSYVNGVFGHGLPWGLGLGLRPQAFGLDQAGRWEWLAEIHGSVGLDPEFAKVADSPVLWGLGARYSLGDVSLFGGIELPANSAVGVPQIRALAGIGWAPRFNDQDQDGIADEVDECPELAEDRDGFEDSDGCPDFDNDGDGVADPDDRCPLGSEDPDGFQDADGCEDPDNDQDGLPDGSDACPNQPGPTSSSKPGCPAIDTDGDGLRDDLDRCPQQAEDIDGYQDEDGCPDPDNDGDGLVDTADACPDRPGPLRSDPELSGCPTRDRDRDTFEDDVDQCPDEPEEFQGVRDDDGCPDQRELGRGRAALVTLEPRGGESVVRFLKPPAWVKKGERIELDSASLPVVRALAQKLAMRPESVALVGVRPLNATAAALELSQRRAYLLVERLRALAQRDDAAEAVAFQAVAQAPGAMASGLGVVVVLRPAVTQSPPSNGSSPP
jgi:hypothetical protein